MTNAELAILSLVAEEPRHGYDIEQVIEARGMRDWTEIGFSSIYYLLKKLEKSGLTLIPRLAILYLRWNSNIFLDSLTFRFLKANSSMEIAVLIF